MKNLTKKGFTLVELIVVITILAILGTIAFISLQGESQNAKNSKVISDLRTMVTAIEVGSTKGNFTLGDIVTGDRSATNGITNTETITIKTSTGANTQAAISTVTYKVGTLDFAKIGQN
jgi:prepilin-type N-terminal cleavage/methylation domain-containing protein